MSAADNARFADCLERYKAAQNQYDKSKKTAKEDFQEAKDIGLVSDDENFGTWVIMNAPAVMAAENHVSSAAAALQQAASQKWGSNAEEEMEALGLSRDELVVRTLRPGTRIFLKGRGEVIG